jgi:aryl-alcohol dehydrogenase-like predicted oxidoreductase
VSVETISFSDGQAVPRIITGAWQLSTGHQSPRERGDIFGALSVAVDAGITAFDCGDIYTGVEELLGEFIREYRNREGSVAGDRLRVHTKLVPDLNDLATLDKAYVERIIDRSLRRLGIEQLDLVQFAWWSYDVERWVETAGWLDEIRQAGKIAQIGATNFDLESLRAIVDAGYPVRSHQVQYSALDHRPDRVKAAGTDQAEMTMADYCVDNGIAILCYGTLAGGFLSDRYLGAPDPGDSLGNRSLVKYRLVIDEYGGWAAYQALLAEMDRIARAHGATIAQVALRYVLGRAGVAAAIVGISKAERVEELVGTFELTLEQHEHEAIHTLARHAPGPDGPVFGLERMKGGRHAAIMKYGLNSEA